jgi:hypothetical protein
MACEEMRGVSDVSDPVEHRMSTLRRPGTLLTEAVNFQAMAVHTKAVVGGDLFQQLGDLFVVEFGQRSAFLADQMIVLRIAIVVLV